jgi:hypothetical protein
LVFAIEDSRESAAVALVLDGPGKPIGVKSCEYRPGELIVRVDSATTPPSLVRHLVEIERSRFAMGSTTDIGSLDDAALARLVAVAIAEPDLNENRILEHLVPELDVR